ncbi:RNA polymerase II transcriptional coactivator [Halyomorpha halys]|uniref:RNA polymerase II transcriptional coactivator n=1 Tax=Halyomorpha halys TaxID=286706 RepID=UPI0006D50F9E|nr:RNA polymerase II transcriptional coactivator-like [Halyomorpha halys]
MAPRKAKKDSDTSDSGPDDIVEKPAAKKAKTSRAKDDEDENSWHLDKRRFLKVREFKGKLMVDIREFYEADGELKPGKKGISLSVEQWRKLCGAVDEVNEALKNMA